MCWRLAGCQLSVKSDVINRWKEVRNQDIYASACLEMTSCDRLEGTRMWIGHTFNVLQCACELSNDAGLIELATWSPTDNPAN